MSLQIYLAHSGKCLKADPISFSTIESLQSWIAQRCSVKPSDQILMTSRGKQAKLQTLLLETELFVYDRNLLAPLSNQQLQQDVVGTPLPSPFAPEDPPDHPRDENSLEPWQKLFKDRRAWAIKLSQICDQMIRAVRTNDVEASVIQRATAIAVENVKQHVGSLNQKHEEANSWAKSSLQEQAAILNECESSLQKLSSIPANHKFDHLLRKSGTSTAKSKNDMRRITLQSFVDMVAVQEALSVAHEVSKQLSRRVSDLTMNFESINQESINLMDNFNHEFAPYVEDIQESSMHLTEEIEVIVKKISSDYEANLGLPNTPKSLSGITKAATLHSRNFLPSLLEISWEVDQLMRQVIKHRNKIMETALLHMQKISLIESNLATMHPQLAALDIGREGSIAFDLLNFVVNLPSIYGSLLVETIHRREWSEKMTADSSTLAEEIAVYKEEEERRRRRWLKGMGDYVNQEAVDGTALGIEINLKAQGTQWPQITRDDINEYITSLTQVGGFKGILREMGEWMQTFNNPSKQQVRRAKAFKNGSIHDAAFGRNSLLLRADDDLLRTLQSDKSKLEDRLKGSESRVRKLEDLLHRQSQISKPTTTNTFSSTNGLPIERHTTSPVLNNAASSPKAQDNLSRQSSVSSRRFSVNGGIEEKTLAQRIVKLEAELNSEKLKAVEMQAAAASRFDVEADLRNQVQEAVSTKKDLMGNFEAQQHEFDDERRLLEDESSKLRLRLEEIEDELDRVLGSRDNEKVGIDERVGSLGSELDKLRREAGEEVQRAQGQIDFLKHDYTMQREKANQLERQVQERDEEKFKLQEKVTELKMEMQNHKESQLDQWRALRMVHSQLSKDEIAPDGFDALVDAVETLAERSASHLREVKEALETARADNASLEIRTKGQGDEIYSLHDRLGHEEMEAFVAREDVAKQKSRFTALQVELDDERRELANLRSKFAAGETGAEALRSRVAEEEEKVENLSVRMSDATKLIGRLEAELSDRSKQIWNLQKKLDTSKADFEASDHRAEEVSALLFSQTDRLIRLLEHIGLAVTKQDGGMIIQRISRASSASTTLMDSSQAMARSLSGPLLMTSTSGEQNTPSYLHWTIMRDVENGNGKYDEFIKDVQSFKMDAFSEAIIKRVKETEHTARKWQREAKAYREKSHRAHKEASEKIAFRSFKEGDLALFLPTRNQATRPWAAFNVGAPHYFLREQDSHKLHARDWLLARISKVEERVVDLSKSINGLRPPNSDRHSIGETSDGGTSFDDENPFELSDGLRWYLLDAAEEKPGAPTTPGLGKSTVASSHVVASAHVDAKGTNHGLQKKTMSSNVATKTLTRSLDSRRNSSNSKKSLVGASTSPVSKPPINEGETKLQEPDQDSPHPHSHLNPDTYPVSTTAPVPTPTPRHPSSPSRGEENTTSESHSSSPPKPPAISSSTSTSTKPLPQLSPTKPTLKVAEGSIRSLSPNKSPEKKKWDSIFSLDVKL